jgi:hypothetical protein
MIQRLLQTMPKTGWEFSHFTSALHSANRCSTIRNYAKPALEENPTITADDRDDKKILHAPRLVRSAAADSSSTQFTSQLFALALRGFALFSRFFNVSLQFALLCVEPRHLFFTLLNLPLQLLDPQVGLVNLNMHVARKNHQRHGNNEWKCNGQTQDLPSAILGTNFSHACS